MRTEFEMVIMDDENRRLDGYKDNFKKVYWGDLHQQARKMLEKYDGSDPNKEFTILLKAKVPDGSGKSVSISFRNKLKKWVEIMMETNMFGDKKPGYFFLREAIEEIKEELKR